MRDELQSYLNELPLVAILRGITPDETIGIVDAIYQAGFRMVEVPLNSPEPLKSIERIANEFGDRMLVGAGTVLTSQQTQDVNAAGGRLIVSPNTNVDVICTSVSLGLVSLPGVATPSEAFSAIDAGAHGVKAFPAEMVTPAVLKSWKSVLPATLPTLAVGGIDNSNIAAYWHAGANGFGLGGALYKAGKSIDAVAADAQLFVTAMRSLISA